jgi:hypothetical protein
LKAKKPKTGSAADRLKIDGDWKDAMKAAEAKAQNGLAEEVKCFR